MKNPPTTALVAVTLGAFGLTACTGYRVMSAAFGTEAYAAQSAIVAEQDGETVYAAAAEESTAAAETDTAAETNAAAETDTAAETAAYTAAAGSALSAEELFTERDLEQTADLSEAVYYTVADGETINITSAGVYVISGTAANASVIVEAGDQDKVQLVLDGVSLTNDCTPCIYVKSADKVFVTTTDSENSLSVTGTFTADGDTNTDAVIFSKEDLVLNGTGTLKISSSDNGITGKDDLKITGGTIVISCASDAVEANDSVRIADGNVTIVTDKDGIHAENDEDNTTGFVYIGGGTLNITAGDDAVHATTILQIDGGEITLKGAEGLEATWVQVNDGTVSIDASDDGVNAAAKSKTMTPAAEFNGGTVTIVMGAGDTDAVDSNGNLRITGGTLDITAQSPFDCDGTVEKTGGTIIVNGQETDTVTNQMMGGMGGMNGKGGMNGMGGMGGPRGH